MFALVLGTLGAIFVCDMQFDISPQFFMQSSLESVLLEDLLSGLAKTPVFGFIIAIVGCHFGLRTTGGTEGVGTSTTRTVVVVSICDPGRRLHPHEALHRALRWRVRMSGPAASLDPTESMRG